MKASLSIFFFLEVCPEEGIFPEPILFPLSPIQLALNVDSLLLIYTTDYIPNNNTIIIEVIQTIHS